MLFSLLIMCMCFGWEPLESCAMSIKFQLLFYSHTRPVAKNQIIMDVHPRLQSRSERIANYYNFLVKQS